ncbi:MAG: IclR family transcriptional regulator, regulon repressor [Miltoncostaeaceae bacterium]|jgi:IclR family acetate operon transcriptional repressor|nr:IclR family transcriptional regulator, regulon repressor [Miltoncostaeaceae bacterium]
MQDTLSDPPSADPLELDRPAPRYRIQAIERAVAILNAFSAEDPELGVTELAGRLGLHKSTVHRFMVNLEAAGLVERTRSARYRLGLRIFELGGLVMQRMNLWDEALPFLEGLVRDTGETGHLAVLDGGEAIYIERVEARRALRIPSAVGRGYPAHATNLGKVLLADLASDRLRELVGDGPLGAFTPHTITDPTELEAELERIRAQGFAVDNEEYDEGLRCIGAPIYDHSGRAVAALGIGGPVTRITPERVDELAELVMAAARGLSRRLGAHQSGAYATPALRVRTTGREPGALAPPAAV